MGEVSLFQDRLRQGRRSTSAQGCALRVRKERHLARRGAHHKAQSSRSLAPNMKFIFLCELIAIRNDLPYVALNVGLGILLSERLRQGRRR